MNDFSGRYQIIDRLAHQLGDREKAIKILQSKGYLMADGKTLTPDGHARNAMTAEERAIDRESRKTKLPPSLFRYNPSTNRAYKKTR